MPEAQSASERPIDRTFLIVGLGNPGEEYEQTPHNLGFLVVDRLAVRHSIRVTRKENMALVGLGTVGSAPAVLAKPQTYMNVSGPSVKALLARYELTAADLVLVYDELDLPWQSLRIKPKGSAAGHNGVKSVIQSVGTNEFARVRLGIHPGRPIGDGAQFVLQRFRGAQKDQLDEFLDFGAQAIESLLAEGVAMAMTKFNRRAGGLNQEEE